MPTSRGRCSARDAVATAVRWCRSRGRSGASRSSRERGAEFRPFRRETGFRTGGMAVSRTGRQAMSDGRTKQAERSGKRTEILGAASELFAAKGYTGTSMRDIASATGMLAVASTTTSSRRKRSRRRWWPTSATTSWRRPSRRRIRRTRRSSSPPVRERGRRRVGPSSRCAAGVPRYPGDPGSGVGGAAGGRIAVVGPQVAGTGEVRGGRGLPAPRGGHAHPSGGTPCRDHAQRHPRADGFLGAQGGELHGRPHVRRAVEQARRRRSLRLGTGEGGPQGDRVVGSRRPGEPVGPAGPHPRRCAGGVRGEGFRRDDHPRHRERGRSHPGQPLPPFRVPRGHPRRRPADLLGPDARRARGDR
ncbi:TetR family transcriptional regulator [Rhodococcus hoagii]|nr:TetR family transcriptional regulator [Prescottella equi]